MLESEIYSGIAETFTDKPYILTVPVRWTPDVAKPKQSFVDKILSRPVPIQPKPETERTFTIYPCVVANMYRIAGRSARLPKEILSGDLGEVVIPLLPLYMPDMVYIIAAAIQNNHLEPDPELILFIERNFNQKKIFEAFYESIEGLGLETFLNSIALARGTVAILEPKASPKDGSELIASHTAA